MIAHRLSRRRNTTFTSYAFWVVTYALLIARCSSFLVQPISTRTAVASHRKRGATSHYHDSTMSTTQEDMGLRWRTPSSGARTTQSCTQSPLSTIKRSRSTVLAALGGDGDSFAEDKRYRRRPRGKNLRRDDAGLPSEKVYAPRISAYGTPTTGGTGRTKRVRPQGEEREVAINNAAKLKVAGGIVKGRRLESPDVFLRPMMAKVKEALFSTLTGFGVFETDTSRFLDLFSGSGSVGIEALSRGAGHATFVDFAKDCCNVCVRNANLCGFDDKVKAVRGDVMDVLYNPRKYGLDAPYDVITVTPPYEEIVYADLVKALAASDLVAQDTLIVLEYPVELGCLPHAIGDGTMVGLRNRRYGRTVVGVWVYLPSGQYDDMLDSRPEEFVSIRKK